MESREHHEDPDMAAVANELWWVIARKRDTLVGRQRRSYSPKRERLINQLGYDYEAVFAVFLDTEMV